MAAGVGQTNGGPVSLSGGTGTSGNGGDVIISGGTSSATNGGNVFLLGGSNGGSGVDGSIKFATVGNIGSPHLVTADLTFDVSVASDFDVTSGGTIDFVASNSISLSANNGINFADSFLHGFEIASTEAISSYQVTINSQAGSFTVPTLGLYESSHAYTLYNNRISTGSLFFSQLMNFSGSECVPSIRKAICHSGYVDLDLANYSGSDCTGDATIAFFVIG